MADWTLEQIGQFQATLLDLLGAEKSLEEVRRRLRCEPALAPFRGYLEEMDPRMLEELPARMWWYLRRAPHAPRCVRRSKERIDHSFRGDAAIPQITNTREFPKNSDVLAAVLSIFQCDRDGNRVALDKRPVKSIVLREIWKICAIRRPNRPDCFFEWRNSIRA